MHRTSAALAVKKAVAEGVRQHFRDYYKYMGVSPMTLTLARPEDAAKLSGLKWVCSECLTVNRPTLVICVTCGKQRWVQLGLRQREAEALAQRVNEVGQ